MKLRTSDYLIIVFVLVVAAWHLVPVFAPTFFPTDFTVPSFNFAGLIYLVLLGAYYLPIPFFQQKHKLAWQVLVGWVILNIIGWLMISAIIFALAVLGKYLQPICCSRFLLDSSN